MSETFDPVVMRSRPDEYLYVNELSVNSKKAAETAEALKKYADSLSKKGIIERQYAAVRQTLRSTDMAFLDACQKLKETPADDRFIEWHMEHYRERIFKLEKINSDAAEIKTKYYKACEDANKKNPNQDSKITPVVDPCEEPNMNLYSVVTRSLILDAKEIYDKWAVANPEESAKIEKRNSKYDFCNYELYEDSWSGGYDGTDYYKYEELVSLERSIVALINRVNLGDPNPELVNACVRALAHSRETRQTCFPDMP